MAWSRAAAQRPASQSAMLRLHSSSDRVPSSPRASALALSSSRIAPRSFDLAETHLESGQRHPWAFVVFERQSEALLELGAPLDQARGDLPRVRFGLTDPRDRDRDQRGVADPLGSVQCRPSVEQRPGDITGEHVGEAAIGEDPSAAHVVAPCLDQRLVAETDHRDGVHLAGHGQFEKDVGPLDTRRDLDAELLERRPRPLTVPGQAVKRRRPQAAPTRQGGIAGRQLGGELTQLGPRSRCSTSGRALRRSLQLGSNRGVGAFHGARQVPGPLLHVGDCPGQRPMHRPALPQRRLLVADRRVQRMRETHLRAVELDHTLVNRRTQRVDDALRVPVRRGDQLHRRPRQRRHLEQHVPGVGRQAGESTTEQLLQARGHPHQTSGRARVRPHELAPQLQREERIARGHGPQADELGPCEVERELVLEQMVQRTQTQRTHRQASQPLGVEAPIQLDRNRQARRLTDSDEQADRRLVQAPQADLQRPGRGRVEPLRVVKGYHHRALFGEDAEDFEHGQPDRVRIRSYLTGFDEQQRHLERTPPRRRQRSGHVIEHRCQQLREPGERQRGLCLHPPAREYAPATPAGGVDPRTPQDRLADARLANQHQRGRAALEVSDEGLDRGKLVVAPNER